MSRPPHVRNRLLLPATATVTLCAARDAYRPPVSARVRELEMQLEGVLDERDTAIERADALAVEVLELEATLQVEQQCVERLEARLRECEGDSSSIRGRKE